MTNTDMSLRDAAQAVIDRWETPLWKDAPATAVFIADLRKALARDAGRASLSANAGSEPVAQAEGVFEFWWADHMPNATQAEAWREWCYLLRPGSVTATHPSPPEGMVGGWQDIATAPEGQMVVVGWLDPEDTDHPERHDFDMLEDGCWQQWNERAEHVEVIGGHGVSYTPPYTVWMPVSPIPTSPADSRKGE